MDLNDRIKICQSCTNKKFDRKLGTVCGLTNDKPTFEDTCPSFHLDEIHAKRHDRFTENFNKKAIRKESGVKYLTTGIPVFLIGMLIITMPSLNMKSNFMILIGVLVTLGGIAMLVLSIMSFVMEPEDKSVKKPVQGNKPIDEEEIY
ncbi:hypothetical protein K6119_05565 [Paracrocinitomix mangrovi]|uniref:hypothetical protein n=1 Tax=Paracrocinitomix mangrovi TaxID=2862509 RepID=UPI001C8E02A2|nr:hypothetical protein [Paracrocinitomix mangrovi]UKN02981.1 hypothetical protein K6119_05565 [Paracrocinitomix mangrovi]